jgi:hypothetical protein
MKHFTDSYLNSYSILNDAVIGIEFEFYSNLSIPATTMELTKTLKRNVKYVDQYHPSIKPEYECFLLTPDYSGGDNMLELITSPLSYQEARIVLATVYKTIQKIGYTDNMSGMHINISFGTKDISKINYLKLMMILDETKVYDIFPDREDNIYCRSIKNYIPYSGFDFSDISPAMIASTMNFDTENRYYGVNLSTIKDGRIEFRYIGGENYVNLLEESLDLLDYFVMTTHDSFNNLTNTESEALISHMSEKMKEHKNLSTLSGFIGKYPNINIEINRTSTFDYVNSFYNNLYDKIFVITKSLKNINDRELEFTLNYDTENNQFELVNYIGDISGLLSYMAFIRCEITGGDYTMCEFFNTDIHNANLTSCAVYNSEVFETKLTQTNCVKYTVLNDCYFVDGFIDCEMIGGVFKNGIKGDHADITPTVKVIDKEINFTKK